MQSLGLTFALVVLSNFSVSCASHCKPEKTPLPSESRFIKREAMIPGNKEPIPVWQTKSPGKPILLLHALNGISPSLLDFALEIESWGGRVYIPSLYGDPIMGDPAYGYDMALEAIRFLKEDSRWDLQSTEDTGAIIDESKALASWVAAREPGRQIAVIGNCLTGNFPLAMLEIPQVNMAVLAQPATPVMKTHEVFLRIPQARSKQISLSISERRIEEMIRALQRDPRKKIVGFHYVHDPLAPVVKFDVLHRVLERHGLDDRFHAFLLGCERPASSHRASWTTMGTTEERTRLLTPHSTIVNPENLCDRDWFRDRLRETLFPDSRSK